MIKRRMSGEIHRRNKMLIKKRAGICHICGHPGADAVDHVIPLARGGLDVPSNKAPAHHDRRCPVCGRRCNREKGEKIIPNVIRRSGSLVEPDDALGLKD